MNWILVAFWSVVILSVALLIAAYMIWWERKFAGRLQRRIGPYWVGYPHGWLQSIADGLKILRKEDIIPQNADKWVYNIAPFLFMLPPMFLFGVFPFSKTWVVANLNVGLLYILAISSLGAIGVMMAGWGSHNKYALLSAMRYVSQMISYEVPLVLSALVPVVLAGSMNLGDIIQAQHGLWFALWPVVGWVAFVVFLLATLAEGNRAPFDIPEAESELIGGFAVEYSGWKFAMFYVGEYVHLLAVSILASVLFLGGWRGPFLPPLLWLFIKAVFMYTVILWIRWSFLRLRVDQLMVFNWKVLVPVSVINLLLAALWVVVR